MRRVPKPPEPDPFPLTGDQRCLGARVVASAAIDAADCALLLAILGLDPADGLVTGRAPPPSRT